MQRQHIWLIFSAWLLLVQVSIFPFWGALIMLRWFSSVGASMSVAFVWFLASSSIHPVLDSIANNHLPLSTTLPVLPPSSPPPTSCFSPKRLLCSNPFLALPPTHWISKLPPTAASLPPASLSQRRPEEIEHRHLHPALPRHLHCLPCPPRGRGALLRALPLSLYFQ